MFRAHYHCLFNAIDPVGDANTAESWEITAIGSVLENVKNVGWHAATKLGKPVGQKGAKDGGSGWTENKT